MEMTFRYEETVNGGHIAIINELNGIFGYGETKESARYEAILFAARFLFKSRNHGQHIIDSARLAVAGFEQWQSSEGGAGVTFQMIAAMQRLGDAIDEMDKGKDHEK